MDRFGGGSSGRGRMCIGIGRLRYSMGRLRRERTGPARGRTQASLRPQRFISHPSTATAYESLYSVLRPQGRTSERMGVTCASSFLSTEDFAIRHS